MRITIFAALLLLVAVVLAGLSPPTHKQNSQPAFTASAVVPAPMFATAPAVMRFDVRNTGITRYVDYQPTKAITRAQEVRPVARNGSRRRFRPFILNRLAAYQLRTEVERDVGLVELL